MFTDPNENQNALANLRFTWDTLRALDAEVDATSRWSLVPYSTGDASECYEIHICTDVLRDGSGPVSVETISYFEAVRLVDLLEMVADMVPAHAIAVRTQRKRLQERASGTV